MRSTTSRTVGAGFVSATLAGDVAMQRMYLEAFGYDELLDAVISQVHVLANRVATETDTTVTEVGDKLVAAATLYENGLCN